MWISLCSLLEINGIKLKIWLKFEEEQCCFTDEQELI